MIVDRNAIGRRLLAWEKLGMVPELDTEYIDLFTAVIQNERVTAQEWEYASLKASASTVYKIKPVDVLQHVDEMRARNYSNPRDGYRECLDEYGLPTLAAPERILNGRLLPPGERNPNPDSTPALPSPKLTADARRDRVERMARDFGADCAARFVAMLSAGGFDVCAELEIVRQYRDAETLTALAEADARAEVAAELARRAAGNQ